MTSLDVISYWYNVRGIDLLDFYKKCYTITTSEAPVESKFSQIGYIANARRSKLSMETID
jgi:hypothetical protein